MRFGIRVKILIFAAIAWAFIFGVYSVYIYYERTEQTRRMALSTANLLAREITANRRLYASTVVKRALDAGMVVIDNYHGIDNAIPLPSTYLREVAESLGTERGSFSIHLKSLAPVNPASSPVDDFQRNALAVFAAGTDTRHYVFERYNGKESIRYMVPDIATSETCVGCHNAFSDRTGKEYSIGDALGALEVVIPIESEMSAAMTDIWRAIGYGFAIVVTMAFVGLAFIRRVIITPVTNVVEVTRRLARGDLTAVAEVNSDDEIGDLAVQTNEVVSNLHTIIGEIRSASDSMQSVSSTVDFNTRKVLDASRHQSSQLDEMVTSMKEADNSMGDIASSSDALVLSLEKGNSALLEFGASTNEVLDNTESLSISVDETARSTKEMSGSIKEVSENIENLSSAIVQVSSSMEEISARIKEVETNATEGDRFADEVIKDARSGMLAVDSTIEGILKIKEATRESSRITGKLHGRIKEIGKILDVIRDVAEETNLLAINAAIIAAQSGEEGKSFSVVANEIKDLAERTTTSAKEVTELIHAVDLESDRAEAAMGRGVESVEEGVKLSNEAGLGLKKIVESAQRSTTIVREISRASADQAKGSRMVIEATEKVSEMARRIVSASQEHARGSELINRSAERMSETVYKVRSSAKLQLDANKEISAVMDEVGRLLTHINNVVSEQSRNIVTLLSTADSVSNVSSENIEKAKEMMKAVDEMSRLNNRLMSGVMRFKLGG
jgi:methyl-accepting chemotaxis protein